MTSGWQRPEGALIQRAQKSKGISQRQAARDAHLSEGRWRQIVNGYSSPGGGQRVPTIGPPETVAEMAQVLDVTPDQLREAGREDAAEALLLIVGMKEESDFHKVGSALERLRTIHDEIAAVIEELSGTENRGNP